MKKKLLLLSFFLLCFIAPQLVLSQSKRSFSTDPVLFLAEVESFFRQVPERESKASAALVSNLKQAFTTGLFKSSQQLAIIGVSNQMLELDLRPYPYFSTFFAATLAYQSRFDNTENFLSWCSSLHLLLSKGRQRQVQAYLEFSERFFRTGILYQSQTLEWRMDEAEWRIITDTVPTLNVKTGNLRCVADRDTLYISNATGIYLPLSDLWRGTNGIVTWERIGIDSAQIYARLLSYEISLRSSSYSAESALLYYPAYFRRPLPGSFTDRTITGISAQSATYPRFNALNDNLFINNIFPQIDYQGGFALEGSRIIGYGTEQKDAVCTIKRRNLPQIRLSSRSFVIRNDRLSSQRAAFSLFFEKDSIYHPGLQVRYQAATHELALIRNDEGISKSPFSNTFHNIEMLVDGLYWNLGETSIQMGSIQGLQRESEAFFESEHLFLIDRFFQLQGIDKVHPAAVLSSFTRNRRSNTFYHEELATHMKIDLPQVSAMLINLAVQGLVFYNSESGQVIVKDRLKHYVDAINNRTDYDVISIHSKVEGQVNALLNLNNFDLTIRGVTEVKLSNTQRVFIFPDKGEIVLKRNLDFTFSGKILAGYFEFYASECAFQYDAFKLSIPQIDSLAFNVPVESKDKNLEDGLERVKTVLSDISGELLIDHPNNKSGRFALYEYPKFSSTTESYVYFDQPYIQNGAYKRENFYYHVLPFTIDSLNSYTTLGIRFNGYLFTGGMLPEIRVPLMVQPDFSLGLNYKMPTGGMPMYHDVGRAFVELTLSQQGLRGKGKIEYLSSVSSSKDFLFHPDSITAMLDEFALNEWQGDNSWPAVIAKNISLRWLIEKEQMILQTIKNEPFAMYDQQVLHRGHLMFNQNGLFGSGKITMDIAEAASNSFRFQRKIVGSETASFKLTSPASGTLLSNNNVSFALDTELRQAILSASKSSSYTEFPVNQYRSNLPSLRWEIDYREVYLSSDAAQSEVAYKSCEFVSTHPRQDNLRFPTTGAYFDMRDVLLNIEGIPAIQVADAGIIPIDGKIVVQAKAVMKPLEGARIIANTSTRDHQLYNATVNISGRKKYSASGVYDFTDESGKMQTIYFNEVGVDTAGITYGLASVKDSDFSLSNHFDFRGNISFKADKKDFYYEGGYRIKHECSETPRNWVQFKGKISSENTMLPIVENPKDINGANLSASVVFSLASSKVYSCFLEKKEFPGDQEMLKANGSIRFDAPTNRYLIHNDPSGLDTIKSNSVLAFDIFRCHVSGWGEVNLGQDFGQLKMKTAGGIDHYILNDSSVLQLFAVLDFFFDDNSLRFMANKVNSFNLPGLNVGGSLFSLGLTMLTQPENVKQLLDELKLYGSFRRFPTELSNTMILSDLNLQWNKTTRSFTSYGPIGVVVINKILVNKSVPGHVEIVRRRTGDVMNIYLEPDRNEWYFFSYSNGIMQAISSNNEFNNMLVGLKEPRRVLKTNPGEEPYQFIISTQQSRNAFIRRMRSN
ncbi:MAG: hypothetical protein U1C46_12070 [Bacteroidales bacterium]|nr:hypothetical protein [Bacteroidales bacterium]MDZ4205537.1 hypothetical protein [Bacteroidales bacterium]